MSTLTTTKPYDEVFDGQKHYRTLLNCTARPGTIGQLDDASLDIPPMYSHATAWIIMALFTGDTTYYLGKSFEQVMTQSVSEDCGFIRSETAAKPATAAQADFLVLFDANLLEKVGDIRLGSLPYPDLGATAIVQVEGISPAPMQGSLRLKLTGPGIENEAVVYVKGASESFFATRRELNFEFPMGVDMFLTCDSLSAGPCVLALPRTTNVEFERA